VGFEAESYECGPQVWEILKKKDKNEEKKGEEKKKEEVSVQKPAGEAEPKAAVLAGSSTDSKAAVAAEKPEFAVEKPDPETPGKKARRRLPKVAEYCGQIPGQLPSSAAAPVDARDF
jgi:hypothetical protein